MDICLSLWLHKILGGRNSFFSGCAATRPGFENAVPLANQFPFLVSHFGLVVDARALVFLQSRKNRPVPLTTRPQIVTTLGGDPSQLPDLGRFDRFVVNQSIRHGGAPDFRQPIAGLSFRIAVL